MRRNQRGIQIKPGLVGQTEAQIGRGRRGVCRDRPLGVGQRLGLLVLHQGDGGAEAVGVGIVRIERQRLVNRLTGGVDLTLLEIALCGLNLVAAGIAGFGTADRIGVVQRPLHGIKRIDQDGLARRFTELGGGLFIRRDQDAALGIAKFDQPGQDGQAGRVLRFNRQIEFGAAHRGSGVNGFDLQRFAAAAHPDLAAENPQQVLQCLGGGE